MHDTCDQATTLQGSLRIWYGNTLETHARRWERYAGVGEIDEQCQAKNWTLEVTCA
jgi:hypothetical protein